MPAAGLYAIHTDRIWFGRDGRWYADGEPVLHPRLASLFSRHLRRKSDGGFEIWIDERFHADVDVEDTPFVVIMAHPQIDGTIELELNDGSREPLSPTGLTVSEDDVLYSRVKGGTESARFLRAAQNELAPFCEEGGGSFRLRCRDRLYPIARD